MNIKIVRRPIGEVLEWVRDAWIGLSLPTVHERQRSWKSVGILSGPHTVLSQLWARFTGKSSRVIGHSVNAKSAVEMLADHHPKAAAWRREHTPGLLYGKH